MLNRVTIRNLSILLASTTTVLAATIISPILPQMTEAFSNTPNVDFLVRLALTLPGLFVAIGALFAGVLLDRIGRKPVLVAGLVLYAIAGTAGYVLTDLNAILVSRAILGIAVAAIMSSTTTLILDYFEDVQLTQFLGYQGAFIGLGGMVFLFTAGLLAESDWRLPFLIHLFALIMLPLVVFSITEPSTKTDKKPKRDEPTASLPWGVLIPIYATAFIGMVIFFTLNVQLPFYLAENAGMGSSETGLALSLQTLISVFAALAYSRLRSRYSIMIVFVAVFGTFAINHFILALSANFVIAIIALLIGGIGVGLFPPNNSTWLAFVVSAENRGRAVGGLTSMIFLGQFFSPIISQPLVEQFGFTGMFMILGGLALGIALLFIVFARKNTTPAL